ncbi:MAG: non-canonical purine NTP pyrophosphatase [Patescibacteria group bacterium]
MKEIIFVTSNQGKYNSAKNFLGKYGVKVIQKNLEVPEPRGTLEQIAIHKTKYAFKILKKPLMAMDAGFFIHSLNGFPMMFTNFVLETIGVEGIVKLVKSKDKSCEFKEILCYCDNLHKKPRLFERIVKGKISEKPFGKIKPYHWSKLALIFIPEEERKTMAQMTKKEFMNFRKRVDKNSHWEQFAKFFSELGKF